MTRRMSTCTSGNAVVKFRTKLMNAGARAGRERVMLDVEVRLAEWSRSWPGLSKPTYRATAPSGSLSLKALV
jgi:hypothetical protein